MKKFVLLIPFYFLVFTVFTVFTSIKANSQITLQNSNISQPVLQLNHLSQFYFENIENANNPNSISLEEFELKSGFENTVKLDSFVYEAFDKNQSKWIRTGKYKNGTTQNLHDTVWFIALWIDSTKTWKEYPFTFVQYDNNGRLIKKELYENLVGSTILVNTKTEQNYSYHNENKTETTIKYKHDYFKQELINNSKTETTYDEKDSIIAKSLFIWDTYFNQWNESRKDTFEFDEYGNNTKVESYLWIIDEEKWVGIKKTTKEFDKEGEVLQETSYAWNASIQSWLNWEKTEFTDGDKGEIISTFLIWNETSSEWRNSAQKIIMYDNNGLPALQTYLDWDIVASQWKNTYKLEDKYDNELNQVLRSSYKWDNGRNRWKGEMKIEKEFTSEKKELSITEFVWNDSIGNWINNNKEIFKYDQYSNLELNEIFKWNLTIQAWQFNAGKSKSEYTYNESGKVTEQVYFIWNSENEKWQYAEKNEYSWDSQNRLILRINSVWNIERKEWIKKEKWSHAFDSEGHYIHISTSRWNEEQNDWKITNINETIWHKNGNFTLNTFLQWSDYGDVYMGGKNEQDFNERGQILWKTSYNWDGNLQLWKAVNKSTRSYTKEGLMDTITYYNWDVSINNWIGNIRNIYFYEGQILDVNEIHTETIVKLYPNPANDFIQIEIAENQHDAQFELFDINGRLLINKSLVQSGKVELHNLKDGIYPWKITLKDKTFSGKIVVKK